MNEKPILFSGPMVRAIIEGRKTMTRRVVRLRNGEDLHEANDSTFHAVQDHGCHVTERKIKCPYGQPGDMLYVKEASWIWCDKVQDGLTKTGRPKFRYVPHSRHVVYCADGERPTKGVDCVIGHLWRYKSARFMPRWASRITLRVTSARVERLQEITREDAKAEGVEEAEEGSLIGPRFNFMKLWDDINSERGYGWGVNPWVWVVGFEVAEVRT